jgi:hypothetical protein
LERDAAEWAAVLDNKTGLIWALQAVRVENWNEADAAAKAVRACGFADWRLPTVEELFTLADRTRFNPAIDSEFFPDTPVDWFWTSTPWAQSPSGYAWRVSFYYGSANYYVHDGYGFVRAVRPGQ